MNEENMNGEAFTQGQKAVIKDIAYTVGETVASRVEQRLDDRISIHTATCLTKSKVDTTLNEIRGGVKMGRSVWAILISTVVVATAVARMVDRFIGPLGK